MPSFMRSASAVVLASLLAIGTSGCKRYEEKVTGVWEWNIEGVALVVTINKNGKGSLQGPAGTKDLTWRIQRGNNFVFNDGSKDMGFLIESADENTIKGSDPQAPGKPIVWTRKK